MHRPRKTLLLALALVAVAGLSVQALGRAPAPAAVGKAETLRADMRKLWEDHITWTRMFIVSTLAGLPDAQPAANRLLRNQDDIGNAIKPFYGDAAGNRLAALLRGHILIAAELVAAATGGDKAKLADARRRWNANADDIAAFLSSADSRHWPQARVRAMLREHLALTETEATARLKGDWALDIATYDKIHAQALQMADALSTGVIAQFPQAFR